MSELIAIIGLLVVIVAVIVISLPAEYEVRRSRAMAVSPQLAFEKIRDFRSWPAWSPWLIHEPDTALSFSNPVGVEAGQEGSWYAWDGKHIGAGKIEHRRFVEPKSDRQLAVIEQAIEFYRPFKSKADVIWELATTEAGVEVSWILRSRLPVYMRPMRRMIVAMIEKDYELGLAQLAGALDPNAEYPRLTFDGETEFAAASCLTIPFQGGIEAMQAAMLEGFPKLVEHVGEGIQGAPFAAYHKADIKKMYFECDIAVPAAEQVDSAGFERKSLGGGRYFQVTLNGSYEFLEMAWYSAMGHLRMLKIRVDAARPSFEIYENDPAQLDHTNAVVTRLLIPIK